MRASRLRVVKVGGGDGLTYMHTFLCGSMLATFERTPRVFRGIFAPAVHECIHENRGERGAAWLCVLCASVGLYITIRERSVRKRKTADRVDSRKHIPLWIMSWGGLWFHPLTEHILHRL